jgi:alpha-galactosidase/6-phospho-beta-glucosidase family protein
LTSFFLWFKDQTKDSLEYPELDGSQNAQSEKKMPEYIKNITGRNWNEEFQQLIEQSYDDTEYELRRMKQLRKLLKEFTETATKIGIGKSLIFNLLHLSHKKSQFSVSYLLLYSDNL